ncbi:MAG: hypothetical protein ABIT83_14110 [Massilia sp.]
MKRKHPSPALDLPISLALHQQLISASVASGFEKEDWEIGALAIRDWMARNNPDSFLLPSICGFQWKRLFLPNGTILRTVFNGKNHHCQVEGDQILYTGKTTSPNGFVRAVGGMRRSAWKVVWVLFPNSETWKLAADLRSGRQLGGGHR